MIKQKKKNRTIALLCALALLVTSATLLVLPALATPSDLIETFTKPYPDYDVDLETGFVECPVGYTQDFSALGNRWLSTDPEVVEIGYDDPDDPSAVTVTAVGIGIASVITSSYTGTINVISFVVIDNHNVSSYRIENGLEGGHINKPGGTLEIPIWVKKGNRPDTAIEEKPVYTYTGDLAGRDPDIVWRSDDESVATVSNGIVTAASMGVAVIRGDFTDPWNHKHTISYLVIIGSTTAPNPELIEGDDGWFYLSLDYPSNVYVRVNRNGSYVAPRVFVYNTDGAPGQGNDRPAIPHTDSFYVENSDYSNIYQKIAFDSGDLVDSPAIWGGGDGKLGGDDDREAFLIDGEYYINYLLKI